MAKGAGTVAAGGGFRRTAIERAAIGNVTEWYDFGVYAYFEPTIKAVFFADLPDTMGTIATFGLFAVAFLVALPLGIVGVYLRTRLADTPASLALEEESGKREKEQRSTGGELKKIAHLWPFMLVCIGLVLAWNVTNDMLTSYMPTYVTATMPDLQGGSSVSDTTSQILQIVVMAIALLTIPFVGRLSDRIGRKPIVWFGSIGLVVLSFPAILLIRAQTGVTIFLGLLIMGILLICFSVTMPSTLPSLFPTRGGALSIAFNVSVSLFGGTTSVVVGALVSKTGDLNWPAYYLIATGLIGAVSIYFTRESNGRHLWGSKPAADSEEGAKELVGSSA